ncbi:MAG: molecular chaperone TorD family protein [Hyphomicrobiaceae bacterium]|nr:molecular chaperone TorD family protein [Hyphomicrobiaceae bacterium]
MAVDEATREMSDTLAQEDALRAQMYRFLARLLAAPPDASLLENISKMSGDDTDLGRSMQSFGKLAARCDAAQIDQEYQDLFIGVGRGELLPYGSYYLTGFLHEKPLSKLRNDMARLGIQRSADVKEPEDHIAALMDMMAGLITGDFGEPATLAEQKKFFEAHISSWAGHFFADLEGAKSSVLYAALGTIGRTFIEIETTAFSMS